MSRALHQLRLIVLILTMPLAALAQGSRADYERADSLQTNVPKLVYHAVEDVVWLSESNQFSYRMNTRRGKEFILVDAEKQTREPAFAQDKVAAALTAEFDTTYSAFELPFNSVTFKNGRDTIEFALNDTLWNCDLKTYELKKGERVEPSRRRFRQDQDEDVKQVLSPDKNWEAFTRNYNLYIRSRKSGEEFQLSYDGSEGHYYDMSILWAPDSRKLVTNRVKPGYERLVHYVESSPEDQLQPKHSTRFYAKPGDIITIRKPSLFHVETRKHIPVDDALFQNPYHIREVAWGEDSRAVTFNYNQRGHQVYRVIEINANSGKVRALVDEKSDTFVSYYGKVYRHDVEDGKEIIWMSERDGWNHLYLYDGKTGKLKNQITKGKWVVRRGRGEPMIHVDDEKRQIIFAASGREKDHDPYLIHYYRINFDGSGLKRLTEVNANHTAEFSSDGKYFVDTYSRVDVPPISVLCSSSDGKVIMELEKADVSELLATGLNSPEVFNAKGRDGKTDIWGIILRPSNFDAGKTYRVIEYIYAGPHDSFVPKSFRAFHRMQTLAELGFILVQIDGMGTSNRSKAFHDVCWKNLKDAGFPDRILWHEAVAKKYEYYDINEGVGIYGHSAGGQSSTGALLFHPDFYTVAVSSAGCHDNRMDKISWNEQWMGYPVGPHYAESSNVVNAHKLQGKLFLIVGELDTNVDPASTLQVADALIKARKDFEFLIFPGVDHAIRGDYFPRRRMDYFVKHLLGVKPPDWNVLEMQSSMK